MRPTKAGELRLRTAQFPFQAGERHQITYANKNGTIIEEVMDIVRCEKKINNRYQLTVSQTYSSTTEEHRWRTLLIFDEVKLMESSGIVYVWGELSDFQETIEPLEVKV